MGHLQLSISSLFTIKTGLVIHLSLLVREINGFPMDDDSCLTFLPIYSLSLPPGDQGRSQLPSGGGGLSCPPAVRDSA